ncbi:hypothetical protein NNC19_04885 [Clostridium sp. SHJSY1]|uniref:hypothetical protein n=1 Tax=Clostridium sp. SHJSY1 TaxID=2942483 RepID=UPI0028760CC5|nr:hypothetical protein [Clostridium sp. SHJSY1]MDS0525007.1 hypothetical protein [Clostridium sp. SHJSY1]
MANETIQRHQLADYLMVGGTYELMGAGFSTLDENPTAQVDTKTYVNDKSSTSVIKGYQTQFAYTSDLIKSEKAIMALYEVGRNQLTGTDAQFDYIRVELFNPVVGKENTFKARKFKVTCEVASFAGAGGETIVVSGNLYAVGKVVEGEFNTVTKEFVEA